MDESLFLRIGSFFRKSMSNLDDPEFPRMQECWSRRRWPECCESKHSRCQGARFHV